ncbi:MAG: Arm DNA-binding domain-containing protein [Aedoeadaptatus pacaensis]
MHVYKKPSGKWAYKIDIGKNPLTGKRQQKEKGGFARAKDAKIAGEKCSNNFAQRFFPP